MAKQGRRTTNELEFQGQVLQWINEDLRQRPGLQLEKSTQEKPRGPSGGSGKRNDLVIWKDRASEVAFLAIELKTPETSISDPTFFADATEKAQHWKAPYFAVWNMAAAELYQTPKLGGLVTPADALKRWPLLRNVTKLEDWLKAEVAKYLRDLVLDIVQCAWDNSQRGSASGVVIDAEIFVTRLGEAIGRLRTILYRELKKQAAKSASLRRSVNKIAAEQGFKGFVEDIEFAVAGQIGYRLLTFA
jgi:hypothetical protein